MIERGSSRQQLNLFLFFCAVVGCSHLLLSSVSLLRQYSYGGISASVPGLFFPTRARINTTLFIPLQDLTRQNSKTKKCNNGLVEVEDIIRNNNSTLSSRRIPRIIHQTSKSRCLTPTMNYFIRCWKDRLDDHDYYFHDDEAVDELLFGREWPEFPMLSVVAKLCASKTIKSDLWRYVALWEYGGIYADTDSVPNNFNKTTIKSDDDSFFVIEYYGLLSQYFMAVSPRHPLMGLAIHHTISKIMLEEDLQQNQKMAPFISGPHALNFGLISFLRDSGVLVSKKNRYPVKEGHYHSPQWGRSITVVGSRGEASNEYVVREAIEKEQKMKEYKQMNMQHFSEVIGDEEAKENISRSCASMILDEMTSIP